jgi:hypothetical protein
MNALLMDAISSMPTIQQPTPAGRRKQSPIRKKRGPSFHEESRKPGEIKNRRFEFPSHSAGWFPDFSGFSGFAFPAGQGLGDFH